MIKKVKIAIIDSGIDKNRKEFINAEIVSLNEDTDNIGHGTAVTSIIHKISPQSSLYIYKLFNSNDEAIETDTLIQALLSLKNEYYDIIHLSCGIVESDCLKELYDVCSYFTSNGTIIISAYDNSGAISYPAAFDNVIGVDWDIHCSDGRNYIYLNGSPINILGTGALLRLPWLNGTFQKVAGSSFAAPYITGIVANYLSSGYKSEDISNLLRENAYKQLTIDNSKFLEKKSSVNIKKAIVFPVNKEIHDILTYQDLLKFEISGVYEPVIFRNVGKEAHEVCGFGENKLLVQSDKNIPWTTNDFDTVILGHVSLYSKALKKDLIYEFLLKCIEYKKNIYAFDDLTEYKRMVDSIRENGNFCYYPRIDETDVDKSCLNKLYGINAPVLAIVGTSSKQGKFSLQLALKNDLKKKGYSIGGVGTEPSSLLFGFEYVFPMGYEAAINIEGNDVVRTVNRFMHKIDMNSPDLILAGGQSQTVPFSTGNLALYPLMQHQFLIGIEPEAIILCVNPYDEIDYINRTISYLYGFLDAKVIAISLYPKTNYSEWAICGTTPYYVEQSILNRRKELIESTFHIPCIIFRGKDDVTRISNIVIDYFSQD